MNRDEAREYIEKTVGERDFPVNDSFPEIEKHMLNGAPNWREYAEGCGLMYNYRIREEYFTKSAKLPEAKESDILIDTERRSYIRSVFVLAQAYTDLYNRFGDGNFHVSTLFKSAVGRCPCRSQYDKGCIGALVRLFDNYYEYLEYVEDMAS